MRWPDLTHSEAPATWTHVTTRHRNAWAKTTGRLGHGLRSRTDPRPRAEGVVSTPLMRQSTSATTISCLACLPVTRPSRVGLASPGHFFGMSSEPGRNPPALRDLCPSYRRLQWCPTASTGSAGAQSTPASRLKDRWPHYSTSRTGPGRSLSCSNQNVPREDP